MEFIKSIYEKLDSLVAGFMEKVFEVISNFWAEMVFGMGKGAYICLLLVGAFFAILILIGLFKLIKKFWLFLIMLILMIGIPCLWYFVIK